MKTSTPNEPKTRSLLWKQSAIYFLLPLFGAGVAIAGDRLISSDMVKIAPAAAQTVSTSPQSTLAQAPNRSSGILNSSDPNFVVNVVDQMGPAVVRIDSSRTVRTKTPAIFNDPFFRQFFGSDFPTPPSTRVERGTGSGFIIRPDGLILTNAHVVDGVDAVTVKLTDGRELKGKVLGTDSLTDVAVVKVEATNLPTVKVGNSDQLRPGEWAIAIGNPLGLDNTVTVGIISGTGRRSSQIGVSDKRVGFIQTDAAINPGNSGGPLLNQRGEVIGMNTAIIGGAQGLGFAIPINTAQRIANQLVAKGRIDHPYLGIQMTTLTPELKKQINSAPDSNITVREDRGVVVIGVMRNSPAAKGGIKIGDVIQKVNGRVVNTADDVQQAVENSSVGGNLQVELSRNGQTQTLSLQPGAFPTKTAQSGQDN
ncbi:MAG: HhoA/HhoB/HtrA family serine endopeptidase [Kovacikia sp.]